MLEISDVMGNFGRPEIRQENWIFVVHVWLPGEADATLVGEFSLDDETRGGRFRYGVAYQPQRCPRLAPDLPLRAQAFAVTCGSAIFPIFLNAGPDTWGSHLFARRLERDLDELESLTLCAADGVGNLDLGEWRRIARIGYISGHALSRLYMMPPCSGWSPSLRWSGNQARHRELTAYRYVPASRRGGGATLRLVTRINRKAPVLAAVDHYWLTVTQAPVAELMR